MTKFIINITLHSAGEADYKILNREMGKEFFSRTKKNTAKENGYLLHLEEFIREGNFTIKEMTDAACRAAKKTGKEFSFTVIKEKKSASHTTAPKHPVD
jgi:hypothetical protein